MEAVSQKETVSIIIPVFNAMETLPRCLDALRNQTSFPSEVVFVDNGSTDSSREYLQNSLDTFPFPTSLLDEPRRGASAARNTGMRATKGAWVVFTDSDCEPEANWLETGLRLISERDVPAIAGPAWGTMEKGAIARMLSLTTLSVARKETVISEAGPTGTHGFATANFWIRRDVLDAVGGFDEHIPISGEDYDLCARLYLAGYSILYSPELLVGHIHSSNLGLMWRRIRSYGRTHGDLFRNYGQSGWYIELPFGPVLHLRLPGRIWINASSAEKKMLGLLLLGLIWTPLFVFVPLYLASLARFLRKRAIMQRAGISWLEALWMGVLFIVKSAAYAVGRIEGSGKGAFLL